MAGTGQPGEAVLRKQLEDVLTRDSSMRAAERDAARAQQREAFQAIRQGRPVPGVAGATWLREFLSYDPLPAIRRMRQPILILQGERDRQVSAENAQLLADAAQQAGNPDVTVRVLPSLNHLFLPSKTGAVSEYSSLETVALGDDLLGVLRDWLTTRLRVR
jgi:fermentation-respiration switch protein FrsA (DUF1100 family)